MVRLAKLTIICVAVFAATAEESQSGILTFTSRAAWNAHVYSPTIETFNSIISDHNLGTDGPKNMGDFTLSVNAGPEAHLNGIEAFDPNEWDIQGYARDYDGSTYIVGSLTRRYTPSPPEVGDTFVTATFASSVAAFALDFISMNFRNNGETEGLLLNGTTKIDFSGEDGFLGVVDTSGATINTVKIVGNDAAWGADNFSYSTDAVPEPSSIAMWSALGIIGLAVARRKRKLTRTAA